jgi:PAS domain S-box-containing protein
MDRRGSGTNARALARVLKSAAALAYAATDADDAFKWALDLVCAFTGWPVGHIFRVESGALVSTGFWHLEDPEAYAAFVEATAATTFGPGVGLPGRILATGEPAWIVDVRTDPDFPRAAEAAACGLGPGFGFPITSSRGIEGLMEFFAPVATEPDTDLLDLISHVGTQLGAVLDRMRAEQQREGAEEARELSEARLVEAQRIARLGSWSWNVGEDTVTWSAELYRIYGLDENGGPVAFGEYLARVHPDDRDRVRAAVDTTLATLEPYEHEYRIVHPDGAVRWVHARGEVTERTGDAAVRLGGYCQDVTDRKAAEERSRQARIDLASQQRVLERIARGDDVADTLDLICRDIELRFPGARCTVLLTDPTGSTLQHAAAPSLPAAFAAAIDGMAVRDGSGACGTAAARREPVVVSDTLTDPLTAAHRDIARAYGLRSVWSQPLVSAAGAGRSSR